MGLLVTLEALTGGDITKEDEVLSLSTYHVLTKLQYMSHKTAYQNELKNVYQMKREMEQARIRR
jgi:hypothetical protein